MRTLPLPRLLSVGAPLFMGFLVVLTVFSMALGVVIFPKTPICILIVTRRLMVNRKRRQPFILGVLVAVLVAAFRDECRPVCRPLWPGCF